MASPSAAWYLADGTTPAPGPVFGDMPPTSSKTLTRKLKNTGDIALDRVVFQQDTGIGPTITVNGHTLVPGTPYNVDNLAVGATITVTYTLTIAAGTLPGVLNNFLRVQAIPTLPN